MNTYIKEKLAIIDAATREPWIVRPERHDDWGMVRGWDGMPVVDAKCEAVIGGWRDTASTHGNSKQWDIGPPQVASNATFIADSRNHRRAELEALRIAEFALAKLTAARDYHDQEIARTALSAICKKLETQ